MARYETSVGFSDAGAAGQGSAEALFQLGLMYASGREVEPDFVTAHMWLNLAAMRGSAEARSYRKEIAEEMSKREIVEAQRRAREWLGRH